MPVTLDQSRGWNMTFADSARMDWTEVEAGLRGSRVGQEGPVGGEQLTGQPPRRPAVADPESR
jgi:hypothetical protein